MCYPQIVYVRGHIQTEQKGYLKWEMVISSFLLKAHPSCMDWDDSYRALFYSEHSNTTNSFTQARFLGC